MRLHGPKRGAVRYALRSRTAKQGRSYERTGRDADPPVKSGEGIVSGAEEWG